MNSFFVKPLFILLGAYVLMVSPMGFSFLLAAESHGQTYRRSVTLEWNAIEGAKAYDVEITPSKSSETSRGKKASEASSSSSSKKIGHSKEKSMDKISERVKEPIWTGFLPTGKFLFRVRARDRRMVPGDWGGSQEFTVIVDAVKMLFPTEKFQFWSQSRNKEVVKFQWAVHPRAKSYLFELKTQGKEKVYTQEVTGNQVMIPLAVAQEYSWRVSIFNLDSSEESEKNNFSPFTLIGRKLDNPQIQISRKMESRSLFWNQEVSGETYNWMLERWNLEDKKWKVIRSEKNYHGTRLDMETSSIGGKFRVRIRRQAALRPQSDTSIVKFSVYEGQRLPAAEPKSFFKQTLTQTSSWFGLASYLISGLEYRTEPKDSPFGVNFPQAFGGSGRLGLGYLSPIYTWGFLTYLERSGFLLDSTNFSYSSFGLEGLHRVQSGERGEFRSHFGLIYKEFPEIWCTQMNVSNCTVRSIKGMGPHLGFEYLKTLTSRIGYQTALHMFLVTNTISTPNEKPISPASFSARLSLLGSYHISKRTRGLMGYTYVNENVFYYNKKETDLNKVSIRGHYLNLILEWGL